MNHDPVKDIEKRTQRYWYEDGIWEIGFGLVNALLGVFYLLTNQMSWDGPLSIVLAVLQMAVIVGSFYSINFFVKYLKEHITYPRTGYVIYRRPVGTARVKHIAMVFLMSAGIGAVVGAVTAFNASPNQMPLIIGAILASTLGYLSYRMRLLRLAVNAVLTVLIGIAVSLANLSDRLSTGVFFAAFGALIFLSGGLTLLRYLRRTRPAADSSNPDLTADS